MPLTLAAQNQHSGVNSLKTSCKIHTLPENVYRCVLVHGAMVELELWFLREFLWDYSFSASNLEEV